MTNQCDACGSPVPEDAPGGACPRCRLAPGGGTHADAPTGVPRPVGPPPLPPWPSYPRPPYPMHPYPQPPVESRLSRMAVFNAFATPIAILIGILAAVLLESATGSGRSSYGSAGGPPPTSSIASLLVGLGALAVAFLGFVLSIVAWARISGSGGRLRGLGFAITGTFLPVGILVLLVPFMFFVAVSGEVERPDASWDDMPILARESPPSVLEPGRAPWPEPTPSPTPLEAPRTEAPDISGIEVGGGGITDPRDREMIALRIEERMGMLRDLIGNDPLDPAVLRRLYEPDRSAPQIEKMATSLFNRRYDEGSLGLPLYAAETLRLPIARYRIDRILVDDDGTAATVHARATGDHAVTFRMEKHGDGWWFAVDRVELK